MKKLIYFVLISVGTIILCGCSKDDNEKTILLTIDSASTRPIDPQGGTTTFAVESNTSWEISKTDEWLTLDPINGYGDGVVTVTAGENKSGAERTAVLTVKAGTKEDKITIRQLIPEQDVTLTIDFSKTQPIKPDGGTTVFTVKSNSSWTITKAEGWITLNPSEGTGDTNITVTATKNTLGSDRTAVLTVKAGQKQEEIIIKQLKAEDPEPTLNVINTPDKVSANGETVYFNIESNSDWTISINSADTWLSVSPRNGNGNALISVEVSSNDTEGERYAHLTVSVSEAVTETITIRQLAAKKTEGILFELDSKKHTFSDFEAAFEDFTIIDKDGDGYNWTPFEEKTWDGKPTGNIGFSSESFKMGVGVLTPENYMILDALQLSEGGKIEVTMASTENYDFRETFKIIISSEPITSENCGEAETLLRETLTTGGMYEHKYSVDIPSSYNGGDIYVGVCHYDSANQYVLVLSRLSITHSS